MRQQRTDVVDGVRPELVTSAVGRAGRPRPRPGTRRHRRRGGRQLCRRRAGCSTCSASSRPTGDAVAARWSLGRPVDRGRDRRVVRRPVRARHAPRRPARPGRRHHRRRQVRAAAVDRRLARGGQPARRHDLRARRLQGRRGVQGLRRPAAHRRHGHRPRHPPRRAGARARSAPSSTAASTSWPTRAPRTSRTTSTCSRDAPGPRADCRGCSSSSTSSPRWRASCPTSSPAWSTSRSAAARSAST